MDASTFWFLAFLGWIGIASIVAFIARAKGRDPFGWWFYGFLIWPVAVIHVIAASPTTERQHAAAAARGELKRCPQCAEYVKRDAIKCRYCGSVLSAAQ